jgi:hypothetical protein
MDEKEKDTLVLLVALCKLLGKEVRAGEAFGELENARHAVTLFGEATDPDWQKPRQ